MLLICWISTYTLIEVCIRAHRKIVEDYKIFIVLNLFLNLRFVTTCQTLPICSIGDVSWCSPIHVHQPYHDQQWLQRSKLTQVSNIFQISCRQTRPLTPNELQPICWYLSSDSEMKLNAISFQNYFIRRPVSHMILSLWVKPSCSRAPGCEVSRSMSTASQNGKYWSRTGGTCLHWSALRPRNLYFASPRYHFQNARRRRHLRGCANQLTRENPSRYASR